MKLNDLLTQLQRFKKKYGPDIEVGCLTINNSEPHHFGWKNINIDYFNHDEEMGPDKDIIGITLTENPENA